MTDPRVIAIRADKIVGRGMCSSINEAFSEKELIELLDRENAKTVKQAVACARRFHRMRNAHQEEIESTRW